MDGLIVSIQKQTRGLAYFLGSRKKINAPDCAGFWFVCKAHPPMHISGYVLVDATQQTDQRTSQMVYLFFAEALMPQRFLW